MGRWNIQWLLMLLTLVTLIHETWNMMGSKKWKPHGIKNQEYIFLTILDIKRVFSIVFSFVKGCLNQDCGFQLGTFNDWQWVPYEVMFWSIPLKEKKSSLPLSNVLLKRLQLMIFLMHKYSRSKYCDRRSQSFTTYGGTFINKARSAFRNTFPLNLCFNQFY